MACTLINGKLTTSDLSLLDLRFSLCQSHHAIYASALLCRLRPGAPLSAKDLGLMRSHEYETILLLRARNEKDRLDMVECSRMYRKQVV
jgi:hypothetical protein